MAKTDLLVGIFGRNEGTELETVDIGSAHADILDLDQHFLRTWLRNRSFLDLEMLGCDKYRFGVLHGFVLSGQ